MRLLAACLCCLIATTALAAEPPQPGVTFDGRTQGVTIPAEQINTQQITVAAWVRLDHHRPPQIIMNRGDRDTYFTFYLWHDGVRMLVRHSEDAYRSAVADAPPAGEWAHLLGTYDGQRIALYVNGQLADTTGAPGQLTQGDAPLYIATQGRAVNPFAGALADVRLYGVALDAEAAAEVAAGGEPAAEDLIVQLTGRQLADARESFQPFGGSIPGYRPIWFDLGQRSEFGSKYAGALGTYTAKHHPLAVYAEQANKTFFVYGGTPAADQRHLLAMASYYDHETGQFPQPTVVHDKQGVDDPHDNPSIQIDDQGHLWVFVSGRGRGRPGITYRSREPYSIASFEHIREAEYTYPQPWHVAGEGFIKLFTRYTDGRELYWSTSADGRDWSDDRKLAGMGGHYQVSNQRDGRVITAFNMHPGGNVDLRTNLYYAESPDMGETWRTADGTPLETPLTDVASPALIRDYRAEGRLVYMKDINFDAEGNPVILYITSADHRPGPPGEPRFWHIAHWRGDAWAIHTLTRAFHNYDMGSLYVEPDGAWRIIAPTEPGPQRWGTGGEIALWHSADQGRTWQMVREVTRDSQYNHAYVRRPVNAHPDFYGFWADGNPDQLTPSHLHFTNREGDTVFRLPYEMNADHAEPQRVDFDRQNPDNEPRP